jgi:hypothetical protein
MPERPTVLISPGGVQPREINLALRGPRSDVAIPGGREGEVRHRAAIDLPGTQGQAEMAIGQLQDPNLLDGFDLLRHETRNPAQKKQKPFSGRKTHIMKFAGDCRLPLVGPVDSARPTAF